MTVSELEQRMKTLREQGCGDSQVLTWDPDCEEWATITCMTYGKGVPVKLYTDEP